MLMVKIGKCIFFKVVLNIFIVLLIFMRNKNMFKMVVKKMEVFVVKIKGSLNMIGKLVVLVIMGMVLKIFWLIELNLNVKLENVKVLSFLKSVLN